MRLCIHKPTGKVLEMQSHATAGTLILNAVNGGYRQQDLEECVTEDHPIQRMIDEETGEIVAVFKDRARQITRKEFEALVPPPAPRVSLIDALVAEGIIPANKVDAVKARLSGAT